jgi:peptidoglycan/LPS O-acetylase OafA/YrhL
MMQYRREIDGLRALAVVPVILYHAGFQAFRGGFVGVDVFFVISGYLITSIIYEDVQRGSFSLSRFYERRIRRILPALYLVMLVCILFAWLWLLPAAMEDFAKSIIAVTLFISNILFWRSTDYFSPDIENFPLIHAWSLSVEEQFYVLFPLLLASCARMDRRRLITLVALFSALSLGLAEFTSKTYPEFDFYLLPTRAWELGVGAIIALIPHVSPSPQFRLIKRWIAEAASLTGFILLTYSIFRFDHNIPFPSLWALVPVVGTALLLVFATADTHCGRVLGIKPLVGIGLISYSAYLWHQPLFAFTRIRLQSAPPTIAMVLLSAATLALAYVSWRFVELPFRDRRHLPRRFVFLNASSVAGVLVFVGAITLVFHGLPNRYSPPISAMLAWKKYQPPRLNECLGSVESFIRPENSCVYNSNFEPRVAIWGDSHSAVLANELGEALRKEKVALRQFSYTGCPPIRGIHFIEPSYQICPQFNELVFSYIESHPEISTIILVSRWSLYTDGRRYNNGEGGEGPNGPAMLALPTSRGVEFIDDPKRVSVIGSIFRTDIDTLLKLGKKVVLVYPIPEMGRDVPSYLARKKIFGNDQEEPFSVSFGFFKERTRAFREQIDRLPDGPNLLRIRPEKTFCNTIFANRCLGEIDETPLYYDDNHLNNIGAAILSEQIVNGMRINGWL